MLPLGDAGADAPERGAGITPSAPARRGPGGLLVPTDRASDLRVIVSCASAPGAAPRLAELWLNDLPLGALALGAELHEVALLAPAAAWQRLNRLEFRSGSDGADPWLVLDRVRFEPPAGP